MNRLVIAVAIASSLLVIPGCYRPTSEASLNESSEVERIESNPVEAKGDGHNQHHQQHHPDSHSEHSGEEPEKPQNPTQAKLTVPSAIAANQPVALGIEIQDTAGNPISEFDIVHEKKMHLIVVSDDLQFFSHIHPTQNQGGQFQVENIFPSGGNYTLFADYKPRGDAQRVSALKTTVAGNPSPPKEMTLTRSQTLGNTEVGLMLPTEEISPGEPITLAFHLEDVQTQTMVTDLQSYLGELGHLVIVKQSDSPTEADYIHAHPMPNHGPGHLEFMTQFPEPGNYKMWGEFNRNGEIIAAEFWVTVK
ncbi:hypothetical protein NG796_19360 [Laspinema sp. A4]|uniref:hypothetical protein n=1 Tax=Laspinema sp. D2d TaxID=2953686 RepID=UPI0021BA7F52|nr:hypothetical protein [Laspinema sp. D2d]MCT7985436.1 hypothetical protein [Laspinema sp. D2d]